MSSKFKKIQRIKKNLNFDRDNLSDPLPGFAKCQNAHSASLRKMETL